MIFIHSNKSFDYDASGTKFWNLFILASDNGLPKRTCKFIEIL